MTLKICEGVKKRACWSREWLLVMVRYWLRKFGGWVERPWPVNCAQNARTMSRGKTNWLFLSLISWFEVNRNHLLDYLTGSRNPCCDCMLWLTFYHTYLAVPCASSDKGKDPFVEVPNNWVVWVGGACGVSLLYEWPSLILEWRSVIFESTCRDLVLSVICENLAKCVFTARARKLMRYCWGSFHRITERRFPVCLLVTWEVARAESRTGKAESMGMTMGKWQA